MKTKRLILLSLLSFMGCSKNKECINCGNPTTPNPVLPVPEEKSSRIQMVRWVEASYNFDGKIMKIENIGWCEANSGETINSGDTCDSLNDYSKIQFEGKTTYLYKTIPDAKPFLPKPTMSWVSAKKTSDSAKWSKALKDYLSQATTFKTERSVSLIDWKYQNELMHKLQTSRCLSSKYNEVLKKNKPSRMGNRLLNTNNIFYFDTILNLVSFIEVDLEANSIIGFPVIRDSYKSNEEGDWENAEILKAANNEVTMYGGDIVDDVNPLKKSYSRAFVVNCGIYYNSLNTKIKTHNNPSLAFFPTYNSKYDKEISQEVDRVLETMSYSSKDSSTDYGKILSKEEADLLIPSMDQITDEAKKFLSSDGYDLFTKKEFQKRSP